MTRVNCFSLVAQLMPQKFSIVQEYAADYLVLTDLDNNFEIMLPYEDLATPEAAARMIYNRVTHYQILLAAWQGRRPIVWS